MVEKDVTINVTNEFDPADQTMFAMSTRPACLSLRRRRRLSSGSTSREKCCDFEKIGGFDDVPARFLTIAKKLI